MKQITVTGCENCPMYSKAPQYHQCARQVYVDDHVSSLFATCPLKTEPITITLKPTNNESNPNQ